MLKNVLALLALVVVSLAPVSADEGYIPYFPDFIEPDGIGFRGPSTVVGGNCWADKAGPFYEDFPFPKKCISVPEGTSYSGAYNALRASPFVFEYRKNYFIKKLFYTQTFTDFGRTSTSDVLRNAVDGGNSYSSSDINSNEFLKEFFTSQEKTLVSRLSGSRTFDLKTESYFVYTGIGLGLDLWFFEIGWGPFLMYHDTSVVLGACKSQNWRVHQKDRGVLPGELLGDLDAFRTASIIFAPQHCSFSDEVVILDKQKYSGLAVGSRFNYSVVFLQTNNWRISFEGTNSQVHKIYDSDFNQISYRGLDYYPGFYNYSSLACSGGKYRYGDEGSNWQEIDCKNTKGEDMSISADYTHGLQITYYFR